jgi:hypothetical protein
MPILARVRLAAVALAALAAPFPARAVDPVTLKWLEAPPAVTTGVSWGVPWPKAAVQKATTFTVASADGKTLPLQTWPLAYWPDGSIKWSGFATVVPPNATGPFTLQSAADAAPLAVRVNETPTGIDIVTGGASPMACHISKTGQNLFDTLTLGDRIVAQNARLDCLVQKGPDADPVHPAPRERYLSTIKKVTVEQQGPVRAVVKLEGMHKAEGGAREWLPFYVRLYFYPGATPVRMVYSFVYDGVEKEDIIRGLGVSVTVPFTEEIQNRHVRFGGQDGGLWAEPIEPLTGYQGAFTSPGSQNAYADQTAGRRIANRAQLNPQSQRLLDAWAKWDDFRLSQPNALGFTVDKRTGDEVSWLGAGGGTRASGLAYVGDVSGGLAAGLKDFWQKYPAALEVQNAWSDAATLRVWLWSPDGPAMDMRHYDTVAHGLNESYEDVELPLATANGIAHTSELTFFPCAAVPSKEESAAQATAAQSPPLLVCAPEYLHAVKAFGLWSLQDRSTPFKKACEDQLDAQIAFYQKAVEQYNWYGFWNFGDVMHSYDGNRQTWKYDVGGFAWDNSEQGTDMFFWYMFLRTGRPDLFRLAEAMTRHTGEVDCYHQGPLAGLGSRHNVSHWGDGAKEARIAMAPYRRFYYYLTTDERTGDVMREMLQADSAVTRTDPMRKALPPTEADKQYPARIRGGPDWFALVGNWMTEWERTGDTQWRDKIYAGMDSIAAMPYWFKTSQSLLWGFDPATGKLTPRDTNPGGYNLVNNMGGPEIIMELNEFVDHPQWLKIWSQYCRLTNTTDAALLARDKESGNEGANAQFGGGGRISGYAYYVTKNPAFAERAIGGIRPTGGGGQGAGGQFATTERIAGPDALKPLDVPQGLNGLITNNANQSSLNMIEVLELCKDQLPTEVPAAPAGRGGGGRGRAGRGGPAAGGGAEGPAGPGAP